MSRPDADRIVVHVGSGAQAPCYRPHVQGDPIRDPRLRRGLAASRARRFGSSGHPFLNNKTAPEPSPDREIKDDGRGPDERNITDDLHRRG